MVSSASADQRGCARKETPVDSLVEAQRGVDAAAASSISRISDPTYTVGNDNVKTTTERASIGDGVVKPTVKRYLILLLFCLNSANKSFQWIQICVLTRKLTFFYDVPNVVINGTSMVFMFSFIFTSWPACFFIDRVGLRAGVLMGSFGTAVGALAKCFSCHAGGIWTLFLGQTIVSLSEQFVFSIPNRLASVWFPDHQVSRAIAFTVIGLQSGVAFGFLLPEMFLEGCETKETIAVGLSNMFVATTALSVFSLVADYFFFDEAPKHPPGAARASQIAVEKLNNQRDLPIAAQVGRMWRQMRQLCTDRNFVLLVFSFGINEGVQYSLATVLDQTLDPIWPGDDHVVGITGFLFIVWGLASSLGWGAVLDRSHLYLLTNRLLTVATILSLAAIAYSSAIVQSQWLVYLSAALIGIFQSGIIVAGLEMAVELTYPAPELVTSSLMNASPQVFGVVCTLSASGIADYWGPLATYNFFIVCSFAALALLLSMDENLKRQKAVESKSDQLASVQIPAIAADSAKHSLDSAV